MHEMTCAEMYHSFLEIISPHLKIYNAPASIKVLIQIFIKKTLLATMESESSLLRFMQLRSTQIPYSTNSVTRYCNSTYIQGSFLEMVCIE